MKVAAVDFVPAWGDLDGNVSRLAKAAEEPSKKKKKRSADDDDEGLDKNFKF